MKCTSQITITNTNNINYETNGDRHHYTLCHVYYIITLYWHNAHAFGQQSKDKIQKTFMCVYVRKILYNIQYSVFTKHAHCHIFF